MICAVHSGCRRRSGRAGPAPILTQRLLVFVLLETVLDFLGGPVFDLIISNGIYKRKWHEDYKMWVSQSVCILTGITYPANRGA